MSTMADRYEDVEWCGYYDSCRTHFRDPWPNEVISMAKNIDNDCIHSECKNVLTITFSDGSKITRYIDRNGQVR